METENTPQDPNAAAPEVTPDATPAATTEPVTETANEAPADQPTPAAIGPDGPVDAQAPAAEESVASEVPAEPADPQETAPEPEAALPVEHPATDLSGKVSLEGVESVGIDKADLVAAISRCGISPYHREKIMSQIEGPGQIAREYVEPVRAIFQAYADGSYYNPGQSGI